MTEITNYITKDFKAIESHAFVTDVQLFFEEHTFSHFPVIENDVYLGCLSNLDIETFEEGKKIMDYKFCLYGFFAREKMIWLEVMEIFAKNQSNVLPVLNDQNEYLGYYEINEILTILNETPFLQENGGIIVIQKKTLNYSIGQITQIIESNNGKVLGLFISESDSEKTQITIKINMGNMNEIIQSFRRYDYEIISEHQDDNYINTLKERSDYLDIYLNL